MIKSVQKAVITLLQCVKATEFIDLFDRECVKLLKQVVDNLGLASFVQAVITIVRVAGIEGDFEEANREIRKALVQNEGENLEGFAGTRDLKQFFNSVVTQQCPHTHLKVYFSYYIFHKSNMNISKASRTLKISRTTLHDHLRIARKAHIANEFPPMEEFADLPHA